MSDSFDRVRAAEMLASNPLFAMLMEELKADAVSTWRTSSNASQREEQWWRIYCIEELEKRLNHEIENGKLAAEKRRKQTQRLQMEVAR